MTTAAEVRASAQYLLAQRVHHLSRLAGVYMVQAEDYPTIGRILERQPDIRKFVDVWHAEGTAMRRALGIAKAEQACACIPYRLWMGLEATQ